MQEQSVELALSELRRSVDVGLTSVDGKLALLLQRADQSESRLGDHELRLSKMERRSTVSMQTFVSGIGILFVLVSGVTALLAYIGR